MSIVQMLITPDVLRTVRAPTYHEIAVLVGLYLAYKVVKACIIRPLTSPLKALPCPPGGRGPTGHYQDVVYLYNHDITDTWVSTFGPTIRLRGMFWIYDRLWTIDPRAVSYVMSKPYEYCKPRLLRRLLCRYMKEGLIPAEGDRHRVQRKVVQKLFSGGALRSYAGLIQEKSDQLRDIILDLTASPTHAAPFALPYPGSQSKVGTDQIREIDVYSAISRALFDLIGQIGIGYIFNATGDWDGTGGKMFHDYDAMQQLVPGSAGLRFDLSIAFPVLDKIFPTENAKRVKKAMGTMEELSKKRIHEVRAEMKDGKRDEKGYPDLLSLMLRSTVSLDDPVDEKMKDEEITGQLATFLFAGTDTTANVLAFGLRLIAIHPAVQVALRTECLQYGASLPFDQMDSLHYLDAVVKETLRLLPSIPGTIREATHDDIIPLDHPITSPNGEQLTSIRIRKGQIIHIPIENLNMATSIWGPDAREFKPERWLVRNPSDPSVITGTATPPEVGEGPGVWPNMMTFIDGPRRCVGYKLGLMEMKILLYTLIREFEFGAVPGKTIYKCNMISTRPFVNGELYTKGYSLPLLVRPYKGE